MTLESTPHVGRVRHFLTSPFPVCILARKRGQGCCVLLGASYGENEVNFLVGEILRHIWLINIPREKENQKASREAGVVCMSNCDLAQIFKGQEQRCRSQGFKAERKKKLERVMSAELTPRVSGGCKTSRWLLHGLLNSLLKKHCVFLSVKNRMCLLWKTQKKQKKIPTPCVLQPVVIPANILATSRKGF